MAFVFLIVVILLSSLQCSSYISVVKNAERLKYPLLGSKISLPNFNGPYDLQLRFVLLLHGKYSDYLLYSASDYSNSCFRSFFFRSPCKLNLFLRILGRRPNGFHDLASLFQAVSLSDTMYFSKLPDSATQDEMGCTAGDLPVDDSNLVIKALNLMRSKSGISDAYFKVYLDKNVPMQAGLGGGSANAATAMFAFNELMGQPVTMQQMVEWSGDIGSDITFFFTSGTAYCTGRGEIVTSMPALPGASQIKVHIFKPTQGLSTRRVFQALDLDDLHPTPPETLLRSWQTGPLFSASKGGLVNDLEPPAFQCEPALLSLKSAIADCKGAVGVMMSGSGTSIYALSSISEPIGENIIPKLFQYISRDHPSSNQSFCRVLHFFSQRASKKCLNDFQTCVISSVTW